MSIPPMSYGGARRTAARCDGTGLGQVNSRGRVACPTSGKDASVSAAPVALTRQPMDAQDIEWKAITTARSPGEVAQYAYPKFLSTNVLDRQDTIPALRALAVPSPNIRR